MKGIFIDENRKLVKELCKTDAKKYKLICTDIDGIRR